MAEAQPWLWYNDSMPAPGIARSARLIIGGLLVLAATTVPRWIFLKRSAGRIFQAASAPPRPYAIVFGAGLLRDGRPSAVLADRVKTAVSLFRQGQAGWLLFSGTARAPFYDEPAAMRDLAVAMGVPQDRILLDRGGTRTFETCLRARDLFGVERALLVSQRYHLPRALVTCAGLGLEAAGVTADLREYHALAHRFWQLREIPATFVAIWETLFRRVLG